MLSYWETESFINYDVIIVGAGITGLSSAISIKEKNPMLSVLVLEKSILPSGASTKNAGFACFGSLTELLSDIETMGEEDCLALVNERWNGLNKLRNRFTDEELGYQSYGGYELLRSTQIKYLDKIPYINSFLHPIFKEPVFTDVSNEIDGFGFKKGSFSAMLLNKFEGQIHTGKMVEALWKLSTKLGVKILTGCKVASLHNNQAVVINTDKVEVAFQAKKIVVCTNAFAKELLPTLKLKPGRGQVLITKPISGLKFTGAFHMEEGYYYFRNVGNRVLFGGGRHLDIKTEETTIQGINPKIEAELIHILKNDLLPYTEFDIEQQWSGIMAFGDVKKPILKWVNDSTFVAVRLGGMGMALGSRLGELVGEEIHKALYQC